MSSANVQWGNWQPQLQALYRAQNASGTYFLAELALPSQAHVTYGAPSTVWYHRRTNQS
jgi:hypothetical protein